ncbi:MAG: peptidylprolyl isomerase [Bacteroidia bacterium]
MKATQIIIALTLAITVNTTFAQKNVIDKVVAVVANNPVLLSQVKFQTEQLKAQSVVKDECEILEELLFQKMLYTQGQLDSIDISDKQIDAELDRRIRYYTQQFGSEEELEKFYGKSVDKIKDDFRDNVRETLLAQNVQAKISGNVTVTPAEVRKFYNEIPVDSLPFINSEVELAHIVIEPPISAKEKQAVRDKLTKLRDRVNAGEDFGALAVAYSEDPGSAKLAGDLGFLGRGQLVPEFEAAAFALKGKEISQIVETQFGFHIIQLIERRGEQINVRHILISAKTSGEDIALAYTKMDSIYNLLQNDSLKFDAAVLKFTTDKETKYSGGKLTNQQTGTTKFENTDLDQQTFYAVDKLKVGEYTRPIPFKTNEGKNAYRILCLKTRSEPHRVNLKDDYQRLQNQAINAKQQTLLLSWIKKKKQTMYIKVNEPYANCTFKYNLTTK